MPDATGHVLIQREGAIATVVLNRPAQRNAITLAMWKRLADVFQELDADEATRVVLVTGAGTEAFSAGADIKEFQDTQSTPGQAAGYAAQVQAACAGLATVSKPTIAVIRGHCLGGGLEVALEADLRIASEDARFCVPPARMGLAIAHHFAARLVQLAGQGNAAYLLLTARTITAHDAQAMGLVNAVHSADALEAAVAGLVREIDALSPVSHRVNKGVLRDLARHGSAEAVPDDRKALRAAAAQAEDFKEGVRAFLEKRPPRFTGR